LLPLSLVTVLLILVGIKDCAFGEEIIKKTINQVDRFALGFYIPYQEFVIKRRD
jgi:hypothetical protein